MKNEFVILVCIVVFGLCQFAVGAETAEKAVSAPNDVTAAPTQSAKPDVAATVNGTVITKAELEELIKPELAKMSDDAQKLPEDVIEQLRQRLRKQALDAKITEVLMNEKVKEEKVVVTDEEVTKQVEEMLASQKMTMDDFKALIAAYGKSFEEIFEWNRKTLAYKKLMESKWAGKVNVTEEDAQKFYNENLSRFLIPAQVRASHILLMPDTSDPNADPNQVKTEMKSTLVGLLKQIKDGADFAELAKKHSKCPSSEKGGDLDFFGKEQMVPEFSNAAFALQVGQVSDVVETQFGLHIIKVTDKKDAETKTFEEVKEDLTKGLVQQKENEIAKAYVEEIKSKANIVYPPGEEPKPSQAPMIQSLPK
ncbi:MAG: peptidylprolyl isomerase [Planctomycetota bacterium]|jgi:peptidyl-prolyl cis-trans isomerase C